MLASYRLTAVLLALLMGSVMTALPAAATTESSTSGPNGDLTAAVSLLSSTNKDRDRNPNTATSGDQVTASYSVTNNTASSQVVTITYTLDGPGSTSDATRSEQVAIAAGAAYQDAFSYTVTRRIDKGTYFLTVTASGTETTSATASLDVH